ncbi:MAG: hypothetical protein ACYDAG_05545 [Chloroflexota bacterium]
MRGMKEDGMLAEPVMKWIWLAEAAPPARTSLNACLAASRSRPTHQRFTPDLIIEVGVHELPLALLDQLGQAAQPLSGRLKRRDGDVLPPFLAGYRVDLAVAGP